MIKAGAQLKLISFRPKPSEKEKTESPSAFTTLDLFCGAGGITEGFRQAGYKCLYGNDCMAEAVDTFSYNHPDTWSDARDVEDVDPAEIRKRLGLSEGKLDVLVGGPPCQGFSINAPERFLRDPRNKLGEGLSVGVLTKGDPQLG